MVGPSWGYAARAAAIEVAVLRKGAAEGVTVGRTTATVNSIGSSRATEASAGFAIAER